MKEKAKALTKTRPPRRPPKKTARPAAGRLKRMPSPEEIAYRNALTNFESAVKLFNKNAFAAARTLFGRLQSVPARDLAERARVYMNICNQRLSRQPLPLKTADDWYNQGVRRANEGNLQEAEQHLNKALKLAPKADYIYYALASTWALRENVGAAIENLQKAITLNVRNRYLAQNDPDFSLLLEDPRFTELLYPEKPV